MLRRMFWTILGATFVVYVFNVEPNAKEDPIGAVKEVVFRLSTICDRQEASCETAKAVWHRTLQAGEIGLNIMRGDGRLVYVPNSNRPAEPSMDSLFDRFENVDGSRGD